MLDAARHGSTFAASWLEEHSASTTSRPDADRRRPTPEEPF
jgi:hypothetical protein